MRRTVVPDGCVDSVDVKREQHRIAEDLHIVELLLLAERLAPGEIDDFVRGVAQLGGFLGRKARGTNRFTRRWLSLG